MKPAELNDPNLQATFPSNHPSERVLSSFLPKYGQHHSHEAIQLNLSG
jgi:hypothetical protein